MRIENCIYCKMPGAKRYLQDGRWAHARCIPEPSAPESKGLDLEADMRSDLAETFRGILREYDAKNLDEDEATAEVFGAIRDFRRPAGDLDAIEAALTVANRKTDIFDAAWAALRRLRAGAEGGDGKP